MRQPQPYKGKELVAPWADTWKEQIRAEAKKRGLASYGTELETFNGRDALQDAMEEMHDAWMYVSQARRELMFKDARIAELEAALKEAEETLLDVMQQACYDTLGHYDHMCLSSYESGAYYLEEHGYWEQVKGRIYRDKETL